MTRISFLYDEQIFNPKDFIIDISINGKIYPIGELYKEIYIPNYLNLPNALILIKPKLKSDLLFIGELTNNKSYNISFMGKRKDNIYYLI